MHKILYLGIDAPPGVFHYPVIRTERIESRAQQIARKLPWTHLLFTSKNAVRHWPDEIKGKKTIAIGDATAFEIRSRGADVLVASSGLSQKFLEEFWRQSPSNRRAQLDSYCINTDQVAQPAVVNFRELSRSKLSQEFMGKTAGATQEGVIALLETQDWKDSFLLYPRSKLARPLLSQYLIQKKITHFTFDLYDTVFQKPEPIPDLTLFDEIVFTSPSTIQGFAQIFKRVPRRIVLTPIGPVTKQALAQYFFERI